MNLTCLFLRWRNPWLVHRSNNFGAEYLDTVLECAFVLRFRSTAAVQMTGHKWHIFLIFFHVESLEFLFIHEEKCCPKVLLRLIFYLLLWQFGWWSRILLNPQCGLGVVIILHLYKVLDEEVWRCIHLVGSSIFSYRISLGEYAGCYNVNFFGFSFDWFVCFVWSKRWPCNSKSIKIFCLFKPVWSFNFGLWFLVFLYFIKTKHFDLLFKWCPKMKQLMFLRNNFKRICLLFHY